MTEFKLWVKRAYGAEWYTISDPAVDRLDGYVFLKMVEIEIDQHDVTKKLAALAEFKKSAKRDALLAELKELEELDNE